MSRKKFSKKELVKKLKELGVTNIHLTYKKSEGWWLTCDTIEDLFLNSDKAFKVSVNLKDDFFDNKCEIIHDDKYRFDNTLEKKEYIIKLLSDLPDLSEVLKDEKEKVSHYTIEFPDTNGKGGTIKTLKEIYELEEK
ncbi:MAG: hypothetical protein RLZZ546_1071 [Bacteroidota bacterium]|jgi:hypothetical protein